MQKIQKITVSDYSIEPNEIDGGTSGSFGNLSLEFEFSSEWDGLSKKVVFHPVRGMPIEVILLERENTIEVPHEVTAYSGVSHFVVNGFRVDGKNKVQNIITLSGKINVASTHKAKGGNTKHVTADGFEQLLGAVKDEIDSALDEAKESGDFNGEDGEDGITPHIGSNDHWFIGDTDTGINAKGIKGDPGKDGENGTNGLDGAKGEDGKNGVDGITPHIGSNGNWFIGSTDTGLPSRGERGETGASGKDGINGTNGKDGENGKDGQNGVDGKDGYSGVYVSDDESTTPPDNANVWVVTSPTGDQSYILIPDGLKYTNSRLQLMCGDEAVGSPTIISGGDGEGSGSGVDGVTFTPSVSEDGTLSWTNDGGLANPTPVNIKGEKGDKGEKGADGEKGEQGIQGIQGIQGEPGKDGTNGTNGKDGAKGEDGKDGVGIQSIAQTTTSTEDGGTNVITATLTDGTSKVFNIKNGSKGSDGKDGAKGENGKDGTNGTNGKDGADGVGIASIVQTTTSTADGGTNIITVTLTNGKTSAFEIKNGSKGSTGESGSSASVTVDSAMSATSTNPVQNKVVKQYVDSFKSAKASGTISTSWNGSSVPYSQTLSIPGVSSDSVVEISLSSSATTEQAKAYQALMLQDGGQSTGSITLNAYGTVNTVAIPINIIVRGDI